MGNSTQVRRGLYTHYQGRSPIPNIATFDHGTHGSGKLDSCPFAPKGTFPIQVPWELSHIPKKWNGLFESMLFPAFLFAGICDHVIVSSLGVFFLCVCIFPLTRSAWNSHLSDHWHRHHQVSTKTCFRA